ncbi:hypothetical protein KCTC52924_01100 [Arenibacter antarcticus]
MNITERREFILQIEEDVLAVFSESGKSFDLIEGS